MHCIRHFIVLPLLNPISNYSNWLFSSCWEYTISELMINQISTFHERVITTTRCNNNPVAVMYENSLCSNYGIPARTGFETCVEEVATRLVSKGHEVTVYCAYQGSKPRAEMYRGVHLAYVPRLGENFWIFLSCICICP